MLSFWSASSSKPLFSFFLSIYLFILLFPATLILFFSLSLSLFLLLSVFPPLVHSDYLFLNTFLWYFNVIFLIRHSTRSCIFWIIFYLLVSLYRSWLHYLSRWLQWPTWKFIFAELVFKSRLRLQEIINPITCFFFCFVLFFCIQYFL